MNDQISPLTAQIDIMGIWRLGLCAGMFGCSLIVLRHYARAIGWEAATLWAWLLTSCLYIVEFPWLPYGDSNTGFMATAGQTLAEGILIPIAVLMAPKWIWRALSAYMWITIAIVWTGHSTMTPWEFPATSFDTALLALYLPFAGTSLALFSLLTILTHHGTTALTVLLAEVLALSLTIRSARLILAAAVPIAAALAYRHSHSAWFDSSTRIAMWEKYMGFWAFGPPLYGPPSPYWYQNVAWRLVIFGAGPGSFMWFAALIDNWEDSTFQMHSEVFQIPFELGLTGALFALATYVRAIRNSWNTPRIRAALFGVLAFCATYHPLRYFPPMLLVALIFREALLKRKGPEALAPSPIQPRDLAY
jgi:hypothetical protein